MNKNLYTITEEEKAVIKERCVRIVERLSDEADLTQILTAYAADNGYTQEEACALVEEEALPTVNRYNEACREAPDEDVRGWVRDRISACAEEMSLEEECKFKLGVLLALRGTGRDILSQVGMDSGEEMDSRYEELEEEDVVRLENGGYTEDMLEEINEQLADAIANSGLELGMSGCFEGLLEGELDDAKVRAFVMTLWRDEQYKYCAAVAACVARKNGELPSIPESASDSSLIIGVCQGIDVANVEAKVAQGELDESRAYRIFKKIAAVGLTLFVGAAILVAGWQVAAGVVKWSISKFHFGVAAGAVGLALGGLVYWGMADTIPEISSGAVKIFNTVCDFTYGKLKQAARKVNGVVREHVVPAARDAWGRVREFIDDLVVRFRRIRNQAKINIDNA